MGSNEAARHEVQDMECQLDPNLWGDLQHHIPSEILWEKLPLQAFFRLRGVCKRWNEVVQEQRGSKDTIRKPYFVFMPFSWSKPSILAFHVQGDQWVRKQLPQLEGPTKPPIPACALHGLFLTSTADRRSRNLHLVVFDAHTKKEYTLPSLPMHGQELAWTGMEVDTAVWPYTFKVIRGDADQGTQVYDSVSNTWTLNPRRPPRTRPAHLTTCANFDGKVFIRSMAPDIIMVHDLVKGEWSELLPPAQLPGSRNYGGAMGTWRGRLLTVVEHHDHDDHGEQFDGLVVCELRAGAEQPWSEYLFMPSSIYNQWFQCEDDLIWSSFCGDFLLVVAWHYGACGEYDQPKAMCLCNLSSGKWEMSTAPSDAAQDGPGSSSAGGGE